MPKRTENGSIAAHGKVWPLYERSVYQVEVSGSIDADTLTDAKTLKQQLESVLSPHGLTVILKPLAILEMSPEDEAEKHALDEAAINKAA